MKRKITGLCVILRLHTLLAVREGPEFVYMHVCACLSSVCDPEVTEY